MNGVDVGSYVLDATAKHADDTGSSEALGVRGLVWRVTPDWTNDDGETVDVLHVATRRHGQLDFTSIEEPAVALSYPCGRMEAGGYIVCCQRAIARAKKGSVDERVVEVLTLATRIKESPTAPPVGNMPSPFPTDDELAAHDAATGGAGLLRRMSESTDAHRDRKASA